jgi:STE24 endopeptidase
MLPRILLLGCLVILFNLACKSPAAQTFRPIAPSTAQTASPRVTHYTLPPDKLRQAVALARAERVVYFVDFTWSLLVLLFILRAGWAARFRDWAALVNSRRAVQAAVFCPLVLGTIDLASLPLHVWWHGQVRAYGLSVQGWTSWLLDWVKSEAVGIAIATFAGWLLYELLCRSPRRWWIGAWAAALLLTVVGVYAEPLVFDPMFYDFQPLAKLHPALAWDVERIDSRVGVSVPQDRILEMFASRKVSELNAYVSGIGSEKRVVFWDTLLAAMDEQESLAVYGHELGHYVLNHIWKGIALSAIGLVIALPILAWLFRITLGRFGPRWHIRNQQDLAALAVMFFLVMLLQFASTPLQNAISRAIEHQADVFGLEVTHGIVPDAPQVAADSLRVLGETNLEEPDPSRFAVFWFYTHPPIEDRIQFALHYDPWSQGRSPEFVH